MEITIIGSGSPLPQTSRAGQSIMVSAGDSNLLFDCGPMTVERLLENQIELKELSDLFFTHQHMDHNSSFFHFVITSWMYGRQDLTVYGPQGTDALVDALYDIYSEDIGYRKDFGRPVEGITEIDVQIVDGDSVISTDDWTVSVHPVSHSIPTYAYRVDMPGSDRSFVYSADTKKIESLSEFAEGADLLVHDAAVGPMGNISSSDTACDRESWRQYSATNPSPHDTPMVDYHTSGTEAGEIASAAGVETLVLTHFIPSQDTDGTRAQAEAVFSGDVHVAEDGMSFSI